jgi:hypothetical protein
LRRAVVDNENLATEWGNGRGQQVQETAEGNLVVRRNDHADHSRRLSRVSLDDMDVKEAGSW